MEKKILTTFKDVDKELELNTPCSFDWETTGLDYMTMEPVGISFCDGTTAFYVDLWENPEKDQVLKILDQLFDTGLWIAHNVKFDIKCCRKFLDNYPENIYCTYIGSYLLNEVRESHRLKFLAANDLHVKESDIKGWETASNYGYHSNEWYKYCFNDAIWAYELWSLQKDDIERQGLSHVMYDIEMPFVFVCADMEINGVYVDQDRLKELDRDTLKEIIKLEDRMVELAGLNVFIQQRMFGLDPERKISKNFRSPKQLKLILKKLGFDVEDTDKNTLKALKGKHEFIDKLLEYKKLMKLYNSYILPAYGMIDEDGRIRASFGIVKTGRTSCKKPNLQQLPRLNKAYANLDYRTIFCAEPGNSLVGGDYSGQELRVLGEVSNDSNIRNSFLNNFDLHLVTANGIFNLGLDEKSLTIGTKENDKATTTFKSERYKAKNGVNFPVVYGSSEYGISRNMGVSVDTAKEWQERFFELYPRVKEAMDETQDELEKNQEVCTMMGRKRRFPQYLSLPKWSKGKAPSKSRCIRQAFNFKIQGFSADQIKISSAMARKQGLKILLIIHDEIVCESSNPKKDLIILKNCMENAVQLSIPFIADCHIGNKYSELK